jgi:hypothetical protein
MNLACSASMRTEQWGWEPMPGATTIASDALLETKSRTRVCEQGISIGCDALFSTQAQFADEQSSARNYGCVGCGCEREKGCHALKLNQETPAHGFGHEAEMTLRSCFGQSCLPSE